MLEGYTIQFVSVPNGFKVLAIDSHEKIMASVVFEGFINQSHLRNVAGFKDNIELSKYFRGVLDTLLDPKTYEDAPVLQHHVQATVVNPRSTVPPPTRNNI